MRLISGNSSRKKENGLYELARLLDYEGNIVELHWEDMESGVLIYPEAWMPLPEPYKERREEHD